MLFYFILKIIYIFVYINFLSKILGFIMKKIKFFLITLISISIFYACSNDNPSTPKEGCNTSIDAKLENLYVCPPDLNICFEGVLAQSEKDKVLARVNSFRDIHGLPHVSYNYEQDVAEQKSALISVSNKVLNHFPPITYKCYSTAGDTACQQSNLGLSWANGYIDYKSEQSIDAWINEKYSTSIGHRRWILSPFLKQISFGRVDYLANGDYRVGISLWIWNNSGSANTNVEFVACPFHDYPSTAFQPDLILSFSVLADNSNIWNNKNIEFSNSNISVKDDNGTNYSVYSITSDNKGYGIPNIIEWKVNGLQYNQKYTVEINDVKVNGEVKNYNYWFKLVK